MASIIVCFVRTFNVPWILPFCILGASVLSSLQIVKSLSAYFWEKFLEKIALASIVFIFRASVATHGFRVCTQRIRKMQQEPVDSMCGLRFAKNSCRKTTGRHFHCYQPESDDEVGSKKMPKRGSHGKTMHCVWWSAPRKTYLLLK